MTYIVSNILIGFGNFPFFAILLTLPILVIPVVHYKKLNFVRIVLNYCFLLYMLCLFALVFFPLPDFAQSTGLHTYNMQIIPFHFIADIVKETPFVWNQPETYLPALSNRAVLQVIFNIGMTVPFGIFLRYYFGTSTRKIVLLTLGISLFIEVAQLTGLFFLYQGSYRLCDVDDLMANTLGGLLGAVIIDKISGILPAIDTFDRTVILRHGHADSTQTV